MYVSGSCCVDLELVTNLNNPDFEEDISGGPEMVEDTMHSWLQSMDRPLCTIALLWMCLRQHYQTSSWRGALSGGEDDRVHCTAAFYSAMAIDIS
jgi:hypothetical protein